jgi:hypothetical protein
LTDLRLQSSNTEEDEERLIVIISSCSARKDDSIPIPSGSKIVQPSDYLDKKGLIARLQRIREHVFQDPRVQLGTKTTYAFDLYARAGNAYKGLREQTYQSLKSLLIISQIEWFFLSGGYGIVNALEPAKKYRATFNRSIAYQKNIPFTADLWKGILTTICDEIVSKLNPEWVYIFGSRDYTNLIKQTEFWKRPDLTRMKVRMFESTGSSGPFWLSPKLGELAVSILSNNINGFNKKYPRFIKQ